LPQHFDDILFNQEDRVEVTANSVHPGLIATNLFRHYSFLTGILLIFHSRLAFDFCLWKQLFLLWFNEENSVGK
jgi:hypothetical protein